jgi:hypothetical protein
MSLIKKHKTKKLKNINNSLNSADFLNKRDRIDR